MIETTTVLRICDSITSGIGGNSDTLLLQSPKNRTAGTALTSLQHLLSYLMHIRLTRTIQRNLLMVESAQAALSEKNEVSHSKVCVSRYCVSKMSLKMHDDQIVM
jgi:hypothetical protein